MTILDRHGYISGLVSDIDLGLGEDGFDVARRARAAYPGLPVVFVSGAAAARHKAEGVEDSIFIDKPYHPRQIVEAIVALSVGGQAQERALATIALGNRMLSSAECTDRAIAFERRSFACNDEKISEALANLGRGWRYVAVQAARQDAFAFDSLKSDLEGSCHSTVASRSGDR
jgi:DNA-binding LytR/AlgR family response regulator